MPGHGLIKHQSLDGRRRVKINGLHQIQKHALPFAPLRIPNDGRATISTEPLDNSRKFDAVRTTGVTNRGERYHDISAKSASQVLVQDVLGFFIWPARECAQKPVSQLLQATQMLERRNGCSQLGDSTADATKR
jgi:hypothetical protein